MVDRTLEEVYNRRLKLLGGGFYSISTGPKDKTRVMLIDYDGAVMRGFFDPMVGPNGRWCVADEDWYFCGIARSIIGWKNRE